MPSQSKWSYTENRVQPLHLPHCNEKHLSKQDCNVTQVLPGRELIFVVLAWRGTSSYLFVETEKVNSWVHLFSSTHLLKCRGSLKNELVMHIEKSLSLLPSWAGWEPICCSFWLRKCFPWWSATSSAACIRLHAFSRIVLFANDHSSVKNYYYCCTPHLHHLQFSLPGSSTQGKDSVLSLILWVWSKKYMMYPFSLGLTKRWSTKVWKVKWPWHEFLLVDGKFLSSILVG